MNSPQNKIKAGILGATGAVGQKLISLLISHPLFEITALAASEKSAGKKYSDACKWLEPLELPQSISDMQVQLCKPGLDCKIVFSGLDSSVAGDVETEMASAGYAVISNSKNHRMDVSVPLVIPEINSGHFELIRSQSFPNGGFIVTNPNCAVVVLALALFPVYRTFGLKNIFVTTMQAISGAGYPGVPSLDILGNVIPHISDEEPKIESELHKIFGSLNGSIAPADFNISAMVNRVPVKDGHTVAVSFETQKKTDKDSIIKAINDFNIEAKAQSGFDVIKYFDSPFRPQPLLDANANSGMTVSIGNLRQCNVLDWKLTALGHNTIRGAAGAAIINAEYLLRKGFICS